jgi:hypothetical protein
MKAGGVDMTIELIERASRKLNDVVGPEKGAVATYGLLWLLGVPLSVIVLIWLIRGH